ncbi:MAG: ATP-binding protein [Lachnospiraceae bacterium]|nr:ATP-binding protein [Lachnospiraceae bacterium]
MAKIFNTAGACFSDVHYMVDITERLQVIESMVCQGDYFTINRGRQYGKTTTLAALADFLSCDYQIISLDFQLLSRADYANEASFVSAFSREILIASASLEIPDGNKKKLELYARNKSHGDGLPELFALLSDWCRQSAKPIVLMVDEVDEASNNEVFLDFLSQLRGYYIHRRVRPTFQSVILTGVYDIKNLKRKFVSESEHQINSPWNIAVNFSMNMDFSSVQIAAMLQEYEKNYYTGMDISVISEMIYDYTSGYPVLVSAICKIIDEQLAGTDRFPIKTDAWTVAGVNEAVRQLMRQPIPLFDSMIKQILQYSELKEMLMRILFEGDKLTFNQYNSALSLGMMFGYIKNTDNQVAVANRIFEMQLYNYFLSEEDMSSQTFREAQNDKNQFLKNGRLDMDLLIRKFVIHFCNVYGDNDQKFIEKYGRKLFLLYLKPVINGTGNYYVEAQTRDSKRTDIVVDYRGEQFVIETKLWYGNKYQENGERQLCGYLDRFHLQKGYLVTFSFKKDKVIGVEEKMVDGKVLVEAVV